MQNNMATEHGVIDAVFHHRFVLKRADGSRLLADLGPKGVAAFTLVEGANVSIVGERKPSEVKVARITLKGGEPVDIAHGKGGAGHDGATASAAALDAVRRADFVPIGEPRRTPKHFEVLARNGDDLVEVHVGLDGALRKTKSIDVGSEKWAGTLASVD